jgi:hypothetical protein
MSPGNLINLTALSGNEILKVGIKNKKWSKEIKRPAEINIEV